MAKKILFYGDDSKAAKSKADDSKPKDADEFQIIQASAYQGERLEADEYEFADDVPAGERTRIESLWGKFDNRQSMAKGGGPTSLAGVERTPASDRRNLDPATRVDDPDKVESDQLKRPGYAPKADVKPSPGNVNPRPVGLDQTTGLPVDREKLRDR